MELFERIKAGRLGSLEAGRLKGQFDHFVCSRCSSAKKLAGLEAGKL
jgi:hypothetical protein